MASIKQKERLVLSEFIEIYRSHPCLWKIKSKEYRNKLKKDAAYKLLVEKLREINETANKDDVVKKINSLRSCFRKEYKKAIASWRSDTSTENTYIPNLWYFDSLLFLKDQEVPTSTVGNDNLDPSGLLSQVSKYIQKNQYLLTYFVHCSLIIPENHRR